MGYNDKGKERVAELLVHGLVKANDMVEGGCGASLNVNVVLL